tara:strand:- start:72 stop:473 length:402 start_codon:yes stop_codon:yes gene_type:complete
MARRPSGKVIRRPGPIGKPQQPQKGVGRPKPSSKTKGPAGGPRPGSKPKPSVPRMPVTQKAMGGQAREGAARSELKKKRKTARQQELMDMLNRLYGNKKTMQRPFLPKDKPKKKPIRPILPKNFKKPKMKRAK